jgi:hypothetical protein
VAAYAEAIASIVSARSLCNSIDLDVRWLLTSILKFAALLRLVILSDASFVFSACISQQRYHARVGRGSDPRPLRPTVGGPLDRTFEGRPRASRLVNA